MPVVNKQFGAALTEGITIVAKRQCKPIAAVEKEIAQALGYSCHSIKYWRRGHVPKEPEQVTYLVRYCATQGRIDRKWAENILTLAHFSDRETLLQELYPQQIQPISIRQNLPPRYGQVLGRQTDLDRVLEGLESHWPLVAIEGLGGIGKTTLAIEVVHHCLRNPDPTCNAPIEVAVWVSAKDHPEQKQWLDTVLNTIGHVLDCPFLIQLSPTQKLDEVDKLLRAHRTLVIVDNFETIADNDLIAWMCRIPEPSKVLLTSRRCQLQNVWAVRLQGLAEPDALELIRRHARRLGLGAIVGAQDDALLPLAQITAGNPKAIEMALGYIKYGAHSLDDIVAGLQTASHTIGNLFTDLFDRAWNILTPDAQRTLVVMSYFANTASREALGVIAKLKEDQLASALQQLVEMSLLDISDGIGNAALRYSIHPLTRAFATSQLRAMPTWEFLTRQRWVRWYVRLAQHYGGLDWDNWANFQVLGQEHRNILRVAEWCFQASDLGSLWKLTQQTMSFFNATGYWNEREMLIGWALELARQRQKQHIVAACLREMAWTFYLTYRLTEARGFLQEARELAVELKAKNLLAWVVAGQAYLEEYAENYLEAERLLDEVEALRRTLPKSKTKERLTIQIRYQQGRAAYAQKQFALAKLYFEEARNRGQRVQFERAVAYALNFLGNIAWEEGQLEEARSWYNSAWQAIQPWNDRRLLARLQFSKAKLLAADGEMETAIELAQTALKQFYSFNMRKEANEAEVWLATIMGQQSR